MATTPPYRPDSTMRAVDTISLSATGSKKAPKGEVMSHRRARYPSHQSVMLAMANMADRVGARCANWVG